MEESYFYNAIAIAAFGDHAAIKKFRGAHASWEETYHALRERADPLPEPRAAFGELLEAGIRIIMFSDGAYPSRLREIPHPPFALYIKGNPGALLHDPTLAVVGTRRATPAGKDAARQLGRELAEAGFAIASGLAFGIDAAAHSGCLETDCPAIAVLAGGLREIYPHSNEYLGRAIIEHGGALVSEYPMSESPLSRRFIERNRIVSGLARGVLIIEAPRRSGALSTARFAVEQNRDVFVLPGSVSQENFKGSNQLIQQGAALITSAEDIVKSYGMVKEQRARAELTHEEALIIKALLGAGSFLDVDKIIIMTRLEPRIVNQSLTLLLFKDLITEERGGGYVCSEKGKKIRRIKEDQ